MENTEFDTVLQQKNAHAKSSANGILKRKKLIFRCLAVAVLLCSVAGGILFGFTETTSLTGELLVVTSRAFEVWRLFLFCLVGISGFASLWGISDIFGVLDKKQAKKQNKQ